MSSLSRKIAWNTIVQVAGKVCSTTLAVVITFLLTHYSGIGHTGYGVYTFALVFSAMFGTLADWGLSLITVREASKKLDEAGRIIGNVVVIRFLLSLMATIVSVVAINFFSNDPTVRVVTTITAVSLIALSLKTSFQIVFNVKLVMHNWAISEIVANSLTLGILLVMMHFSAGLVEIMLAFLVGDFVTAGVAVYLGRRLLDVKLALVRPETKYLLVEALPMGAILVVFTIYNRIDTVMLSFFKGADAVADYGLAYRVYEVIVLGAAYFSNAILPVISNLAETDREGLRRVFRQSFGVLFFLGVGAAIATIVLAPVAVGILGGPSFGAATLALRILALALVVSYFNHLVGYTIVALRKQWWSLRIAVVALGVNLGLNLWLIPHFSLYAAAVNTFLTEGLIVVLGLLVIRKELGVTPRWQDLGDVVREVMVKKRRLFEKLMAIR